MDHSTDSSLVKFERNEDFLAAPVSLIRIAPTPAPVGRATWGKVAAQAREGVVTETEREGRGGSTRCDTRRQRQPLLIGHSVSV